MPGPGLDCFGPEEKAAVLEVLESQQLSRYRFDDDPSPPSKVYDFEQSLMALTEARYCLGMNSCTSALLTGLWAAGIGQGCEVIVPGYMFVGSIASIAYAGAIPVLAEIDESLTLDPVDVERRITPRTRAIMAVHMLGAPSNMTALQDIANRYSLMLIEDCAQAGGGTHRGQHLGTFGSYGAFSLNVFKTFTAGDGGVLLTNDTGLYERAFAIHDHGARPLRLGVTDNNSFFGLNFRMHEVTGALAGAQLKKLPSILEQLRANKAEFREAIGPLPGLRQRQIHDPDGECATTLVYVCETAPLARAIADAMGGITLAQSGKHNYANIPQLVRMSEPPPVLPGGGPMPTLHYPHGMLPQTDDVLSRSIALSIGVTDSYLGTHFGLDIHADDSRITAVADEFRRTASRIIESV